jgi:hypothetical protein
VRGPELQPTRYAYGGLALARILNVAFLAGSSSRDAEVEGLKKENEKLIDPEKLFKLCEEAMKTPGWENSRVLCTGIEVWYLRGLLAKDAALSPVGDGGKEK